jgi:hypothetical protein
MNRIWINTLNDVELMQLLRNLRLLGQRGHHAYSLVLHRYASIEAQRRKLV